MQRPILTTLCAAPAWGLVLIALVGCGGAQPSWEADFPDDASSEAKGAAGPKSPPGRLLRVEVDQVLAEGPSWILRRVVPEEVIREGVFVGWRVVAMPNEWSHLAIRPGDVVTRVNGAAIERPDDLWSAWVMLATAKELRIVYEREGAAREYVLPIDGPPTDMADRLRANARVRPARQPKGTVVIEEGGMPSGDEEETPHLHSGGSGAEKDGVGKDGKEKEGPPPGRGKR